MINFTATADPFSLEILRDGRSLGHLQFHSTRQPRAILRNADEELTVTEMWDCLYELSRRGKFHAPADRPLRNIVGG